MILSVISPKIILEKKELFSTMTFIVEKLKIHQNFAKF